MSIKDRNLRAGTKLIARHKGATHRAEVVEADDGLCYRLEDGREFKSPSGAGRAVMDGKACNGWVFWSVGDGEASASTTAATPKPATGRSKKAGAKAASEAAADRA